MIHGKIEPFLCLKNLTIPGLNCVGDESNTIYQSIKAKRAFLDILHQNDESHWSLYLNWHMSLNAYQCNMLLYHLNENLLIQMLFDVLEQGLI